MLHLYYSVPCVLGNQHVEHNLFSDQRILIQDSSNVPTGAGVLVDHCVLQEMLEAYRLHDLVLEYLELTIHMDDDLKNNATSRQARYLGSLHVLRDYSVGLAGNGPYSLVALWNAVAKLDNHLSVKQYYLDNLRGVTETRPWHDAGHLLRLLVSDLYSLYVCNQQAR